MIPEELLYSRKVVHRKVGTSGRTRMAGGPYREVVLRRPHLDFSHIPKVTLNRKRRRKKIMRKMYQEKSMISSVRTSTFVCPVERGHVSINAVYRVLCDGRGAFSLFRSREPIRFEALEKIRRIAKSTRRRAARARPTSSALSAGDFRRRRWLEVENYVRSNVKEYYVP